MDRPFADKPRALAAGARARPALVAGELAALAALILACAALFAWAAAGVRPMAPVAAGQLNLGPAFYAGLNGAERHGDGYDYMWTTGSALVQLRGAYHLAPAYLAEVRVRAANPAGPQPLTVLAGGQPLVVTTPDAEQFRTYRLLLGPATAAAGAELWLGLQTPPFTPPGDARDLGVMLTDVTLTPLPGPALPRAIAVGLALLALWALLRLGAVPAGDTLALVALAGLALAALPALSRPPVVPTAWLAGLALAGAAGAGLLVRRADRRAAPASRGVSALLPARLGLAALAVLVAYSGVLWPAWLSDDAFISFRYAQNLAQGHGLVYNLGERVEGYTNFLWTVLAALLIALGGDVAVWSHLAGGALGVAIVLLTYRLGARLLGPPWGLLAALVCATSQSLLLYTGRGSGLETGLFTLLVLAGSERYLRAEGRAQRELGAAGLLFALAALTRPEGVLVFAFAAAHLVLHSVLARLLAARHGEDRATDRADGRGVSKDQPARALSGPRPSSFVLGLPWRQIATLAGAFLAIYLPYFAWRLWYYGDLLPNTFYAKTGGGLSQVLRGAEYAGGFALTLGGPLLLIVFAPWLRRPLAALASWRGYGLPLVLLYSLYIVLVGGDHFRGERFFVPLLPLIAILMADGAATVAGALAPALRGALRPLAALACGLALAAASFGALARTAPIDPIIQGLDESVWIWRDIGWWMADHTPPEASLAAAGAGAVAFYGERETIDMYGLTDRHIGRLAVEGMGEGVAGHEKRDPLYILEVRRPTYIPRIWEEYFGGPPALADAYSPITVLTRSGRALDLWERK